MCIRDKPSIERPAVQSPVDAHECGIDTEHQRRLSNQKYSECDQTDHAGNRENRLPAERVGKPAGREFQRENDETLHGEGRAQLGDRQAPIEWEPVSYTHLRAHETVLDLVCRLLLEKKKTK